MLQRKQFPLTKCLVPVHFTQTALWYNWGRSCAVVVQPLRNFLWFLYCEPAVATSQVTWQGCSSQDTRSEQPHAQPASPHLPTVQSKSLSTVYYTTGYFGVQPARALTAPSDWERITALSGEKNSAQAAAHSCKHLFQGIHQRCTFSNTPFGDVNHLDEQLYTESTILHHKTSGHSFICII